MSASRFQLPRRKHRAPKLPGESDWKMNLVLILLIFQTILMAWWWWTGSSPSTSNIVIPTSTVTSPVETPVIASEPSSYQSETTNEPIQSRRSFRDEPIRIQLLNGCGTRGLANRYADCLRMKGFDVRETGNADRYTYPKTQVIGRVLDAALPRVVADSLGVKDVSVNPNPALVDIEVTVIVGKDNERLHCR